MASRVLIIEDNPANLELMRYLLHAFGYEVIAAADGRQGIVAAQAGLPEIIICDVQLPDMSGIDVARQLKSDPRSANIPLLAVTAFAMLGDRERLLAAGFDDYIAKPIDPEVFVAQIASHLRAGAPAPVTRSEESGTEAAKQAPRNGLIVLAVDNLQVNLDFAAGMLRHMGYDVVTADTCDEALRAAREHSPDLILSDVCMPGAGGYELIAELKSDMKLRDIPVIFLTSTALDDADQRKGLALGAVRYLIRPIEPQRLLAEVDACLQQVRKP